MALVVLLCFITCTCTTGLLTPRRLRHKKDAVEQERAYRALWNKEKCVSLRGLLINEKVKRLPDLSGSQWHVRRGTTFYPFALSDYHVPAMKILLWSRLGSIVVGKILSRKPLTSGAREEPDLQKQLLVRLPPRTQRRALSCSPLSPYCPPPGPQCVLNECENESQKEGRKDRVPASSLSSFRKGGTQQTPREGTAVPTASDGVPTRRDPRARVSSPTATPGLGEERLVRLNADLRFSGAGFWDHLYAGGPRKRMAAAPTAYRSDLLVPSAALRQSR